MNHFRAGYLQQLVAACHPRAVGYVIPGNWLGISHRETSEAYLYSWRRIEGTEGAFISSYRGVTTRWTHIVYFSVINFECI